MNRLFSTTNTGDTVNKVKKPSLYDKYSEAIHSYTDNKELLDLLFSYVNMQLEICSSQHRTMYINMFKGRLNELTLLSDNVSEQCKIVQQSISNGWVHFYALRTNRTKDPMNESGVVKSIKAVRAEREVAF